MLFGQNPFIGKENYTGEKDLDYELMEEYMNKDKIQRSSIDFILGCLKYDPK